MGTQNYSQVMQAYAYIYIVTYYANNVLSVAQRSIDLHVLQHNKCVYHILTA